MTRIMKTNGFRVNYPSWRKKWVNRQEKVQDHIDSWKNPVNWQELSEWLGNRTSKRLVGSNTTATRNGDGSISIMLFGNEILNFDPILPIVAIFDCGYQTTTTKQRINQFSRLNIWQKNHKWFYADKEGIAQEWQGMAYVDSFGNVTPVKPSYGYKSTYLPTSAYSTAVQTYFASVINENFNIADFDPFMSEILEYGYCATDDILPNIYDLIRADHFPIEANEAIDSASESAIGALSSWLDENELSNILTVITTSDLAGDEFTGYGLNIRIVSSDYETE